MTEQQKIVLYLEEAKDKDKDGKIVVAKDQHGSIAYLRHDPAGLMGLISNFDSRMHTMQDLKCFMKMKDDIRITMMGNDKLIVDMPLSLNCMSALKSFLQEYRDKEGKLKPMAELEAKCFISLTEQLDIKVE